jgi:hypothetical protein
MCLVGIYYVVPMTSRLLLDIALHPWQNHRHYGHQDHRFNAVRIYSQDVSVNDLLPARARSSTAASHRRTHDVKLWRLHACPLHLSYHVAIRHQTQPRLNLLSSISLDLS